MNCLTRENSESPPEFLNRFTLYRQRQSSAGIRRQKTECSVSEIFVALDPPPLRNNPLVQEMVNGIVKGHHEFAVTPVIRQRHCIQENAPRTQEMRG